MATECEERGRTVALCVSQWNHPTTFYAWTWLRQYFLRRSPGGPEDAAAGLHPCDNLIIVRVGKHLDESERWKVGGPLIPDVDTALQNYPHQIHQLQGSLQSKMRSFIEEHSIDVVVLGDEFPQSGFKLTSVTEWVKEKVSCPFIIIRPEAVRNVRMRIGSNKGDAEGGGSLGTSPPAPNHMPAGVAAGGGGGGEGRVPSPVPPSRKGRKICIAYERFDIGQHLMEKAKQVVLEPEDTVYVAHCFPGKDGGAPQWLHPTQMMKQAGKLAKAMTFQRGGSHNHDQEVTPDNAIDFGAKELEEFNVVLNVVLRGDPKSALERFCEGEGIDLLVIGTRAGGKLRKTLTGGSVSGHLIDKAPCPCLVIPYKAMGISAEASLSGGEDEGAAGSSPRGAGLPASPFSQLLSFGQSPGVDAATQTESTATPPQSASVAAQLELGGSPPGQAAGAGVGGGDGGGAAHSTPSDMLAVLRQQLEEKDRVIAELRAQVQQLQLAQAENRDTQTHDPLLVPANY